MDAMSRREMLCRAGTGFGLLGLAGLLAEGQESDRAVNPVAPRAPRHRGRARRVIFLYMAGGPAQMDLFDPKPRLTAESGKPIPLGTLGLTRVAPGKLLGSPWSFRKHGESGIDVSELLPN